AGANRVDARAVDLRLVTVGEARSVLGAEILPAIALVVDAGLDAENEVLVIAALAEEMPEVAVAGEDAVLDRPHGFIVRMAFPAGAILAVEERPEGCPALRVRAGGGTGDRFRHRRCLLLAQRFQRRLDGFLAVRLDRELAGK